MCAPASTRGGHGGGRRPVALGGRHVAADRPARKRLARRSDQQRPPELAELVQPRQHLVAVRRLLGEAEPGIDEDALRGDAGAGRERDALAQLVEHFVDDVVIDAC